MSRDAVVAAKLGAVAGVFAAAGPTRVAVARPAKVMVRRVFMRVSFRCPVRGFRTVK
jgi:hypothetical protein